jgi:hypothetical protein
MEACCGERTIHQCCEENEALTIKRMFTKKKKSSQLREDESKESMDAWSAIIAYLVPSVDTARAQS